MDGLVGDPDAEVRCARTGALLSRGYERVLLGDHGPYFELDRDRVVWSNLRLVPGGAARFYDEWRVAAPSLRDDDPDPTKLYDQLRPVTGQRNPPRDSAWAVANNRPESEGYAEYLPGRVYLGAHRASVAGRAMPQRRVGGRVAWWKPSERRGAIIPDGVVGVRNLATERATVGEIAVRADQLADGVDALVPGEGVWFDVVEEHVRREPEGGKGGGGGSSSTSGSNSGSGSSSTSGSNSNPAVSAVAVSVSGPGDEPTRQLCPGAAEAAAAALAAARVKSAAAAAAKGRGKKPAEEAASRAKLEGDARAEAERAAVAGACRRVARILRENYPRIFAQRERRAKTEAGEEDGDGGEGEGESLGVSGFGGCGSGSRLDETSTPSSSALPAWLSAIGRGATACAVGDTAAGDASSRAREAAERCAAAFLAKDSRGGGGGVLVGAPEIVELTAEGLRSLRESATNEANGSEANGSEANGSYANGSYANGSYANGSHAASLARRAFDETLPTDGVGSDALVVALPPRPPAAALGRRAVLALRASPRAVAVVVVSPGPDKAVRDAVALAGACAEGTPPFVPTFAFAVVVDEGEDEKNRGGDAAPAACVTVMVREGMGDAAGLEEATGRAYCWACGDATHRKATCPRRGGTGGGGGGGGGGIGGGNGRENGDGASSPSADRLAGMVEKTRLG